MQTRHFIPVSYADLSQACRQHMEAHAVDMLRFERDIAHIEQHFLTEFYQFRNNLKAAYAAIDPDADTVSINANIDAATDADTPDVMVQMEQLLLRANYVRVTPEALKRAFAAASLFQLRLTVDMDDFEDVVLFSRGASEREETLPWLFGLRKRAVQFTNYERVVLCLRYKSNVDTQATLGGCRPGSTMLKLFQNVPEADMEMLFPNTRVGMRWRDKLMIGIPALVSGVVMFTTKLGATLVLLGSLMGFWLGLHSEEITLDRTTLLALGAGFGALAAYLWKQYASFKNRRLRFTQALTENLYFKLLDNNQGVMLRVLDDAQESECKEALLAYCFMMLASQPVTAADLDRDIEAWFYEAHKLSVDFDIHDALNKLQALGLAQCHASHWQACVAE